jgi:hypothetical protein
LQRIDKQILQTIGRRYRLMSGPTGQEKTMKDLFIAILVMIGIAGFSAGVNAKPNNSVFVKIGHEKTTSKGNMRVKFLEMIEDSRCPRDVQCIQAGNASIRVRVTRGGRSQVMVLNTNRPSEGAFFAGYRFALTALTPEPASNIRINRNGYVATIEFVKT